MVPLRIGRQERNIEFLISRKAQKAILGLGALRIFGFDVRSSEECLTTANGEKIFCHAISVEEASKNDQRPQRSDGAAACDSSSSGTSPQVQASC